MANPLVEKLLGYLAHTQPVDSLQLAKEWEEDHQKVVGAIKSVQCAGDIIEVENRSEVRTELTPEGINNVGFLVRLNSNVFIQVVIIDYQGRKLLPRGVMKPSCLLQCPKGQAEFYFRNL